MQKPARIVVLIAGAYLLFYIGWRYWPTKPVIERAAIRACQRDYGFARTAADTAAIDDRVWVVSREPLRRIPPCGELRKASKL